jgi:molecular chaperone GrpE
MTETTTEEKAPADQEATTETTASPQSCEETSDNKKCSDKTTELTATLQRLQAEFENFKKRNEKEKAMFIQFANKQLLMEIIPIIDNFERAQPLDEGMTLVYNELMDVITRHGVKVMETENQKFNPTMHEAMLQEPSEKPAGMILETLQKGYILGEAVLRPARVKIAKKKEDTDEAQGVQAGGN